MGRCLASRSICLAADHQSKADIGASIARQWFDADKVDMVIGFDNSSVALAVEQLAFQKNRIAIAGAIGTTAFTGKSCTPNEAAWVYDAYALTNTLARSVVARGQDTWFFITVDYSLGHSLEADATSAVVASGGKVLGSARHPLNTADFSAYLLQAQASGAKVVAMANAGGDMTNATKQANEFGLTRAGQTVVSLLTFITDVNSVGLKAAQGLTFVTAFYWDRDDESRAWSKRFFELHKRMPTMAQAAVYSAIRHYLTRDRSGRYGRGEGGNGQDARDPRQRFLCEERQGARRRSYGSRHVFRAGQDAGGIDRPLGLLQDPVDHSGRSGLSSPGRRRMPLGQTAISGCAASLVIHRSLMKEVMTHAELDDQRSKLLR